MNNTLCQLLSPQFVPGKKKERAETTWHEKWSCWMRKKVRCWCVLWLWDINASHCSDKQQTIFFTTSGKREATATAGQDRSSSQSVGRAPANLNKEGRREEGNEGRRETWLGSTPAQALPSMMWNGKGRFYFMHKEIILPSNCLLSSGIAAKLLTAAAARACYGCASIFGYFYFVFAQIFAW